MAGAPAFSGRQEELLAAAVRVTAAHGLRGLTHRAVDAEAGVAQGSCSAYMRTRLALLTRLTEYVSASFARDISALTARIEVYAAAPQRSADSVAAYAVQQTALMLRTWLRDPDLLLVRMELGIEGSRQPDIAAIVQAQSAQLVAVVEHAMASAGHEHGQVRAVTLIAALDGLLLRALREEPARRERLTAQGVELLLRSLLGDVADAGV